MGTDEFLVLLESVLRREPDHPLANHLYVHVLDTSPHPERALGSAYRLAQLAPGAGHLLHMGGHIFWDNGDYQMAAHVNELAVEADREYVRLTGVTDSIYSEAYYAHNLHFISRANVELGRYEEAKKAADLLSQHVLPAYSDMPGMVDGYLSNPFLVLLRFQHWDEVLQYPKPDPRMGMSIALWRYARAVALAAKGDHKAALDEQAAFQASRPGVRAQTLRVRSSRSLPPSLKHVWRVTTGKRSPFGREPSPLRMRLSMTILPLGIFPCGKRLGQLCCAVGGLPRLRLHFVKTCSITHEAREDYWVCGRV